MSGRLPRAGLLEMLLGGLPAPADPPSNTGWAQRPELGISNAGHQETLQKLDTSHPLPRLRESRGIATAVGVARRRNPGCAVDLAEEPRTCPGDSLASALDLHRVQKPCNVF